MFQSQPVETRGCWGGGRSEEKKDETAGNEEEEKDGRKNTIYKTHFKTSAKHVAIRRETKTNNPNRNCRTHFYNKTAERQSTELHSKHFQFESSQEMTRWLMTEITRAAHTLINNE